MVETYVVVLNRGNEIKTKTNKQKRKNRERLTFRICIGKVKQTFERFSQLDETTLLEEGAVEGNAQLVQTDRKPSYLLF